MKNLFKHYWHVLLVIFIVPAIFIFYILKKYGMNNSNVISITTAAFAYYGTVILAVVTLLQNEKITEISKRSADIEEVRLRNQYHPIIEFDSILDSNQEKYKLSRLVKQDIDLYQTNSASDLIWIVITNKGNASAYNITYYDFGLLAEEDGEKTGKLKYDYRERTYAELKPNESIFLEYHIDYNTIFNINFNLCYQNEYGQFFYSPMAVRIGGDETGLYAQCGIGKQEIGKSHINVKEWYYET